MYPEVGYFAKKGCFSRIKIPLFIVTLMHNFHYDRTE